MYGEGGGQDTKVGSRVNSIDRDYVPLSARS